MPGLRATSLLAGAVCAVLLFAGCGEDEPEVPRISLSAWRDALCTAAAPFEQAEAAFDPSTVDIKANPSGARDAYVTYLQSLAAVARDVQTALASAGPPDVRDGDDVQRVFDREFRIYAGASDTIVLRLQQLAPEAADFSAHFTDAFDLPERPGFRAMLVQEAKKRPGITEAVAAIDEQPGCAALLFSDEDEEPEAVAGTSQPVPTPLAQDPRCTGTDVAACREAVAAMVLRDAPAISGYWQRRLTRIYIPFLVPEVKAYLEPIASRCGRTSLRNAAYCPADNTIYYDLAFLAELTKQYGPQVPEIVLAHEYGHAVQAHLGLLGVDWLFDVEVELQADCFAGVYVTAGAAARGKAYSDQALAIWETVGDAATVKWFEPGAHGTVEQRRKAFITGREQGLGKCIEVGTEATQQ